MAYLVSISTLAILTAMSKYLSTIIAITFVAFIALVAFPSTTPPSSAPLSSAQSPSQSNISTTNRLHHRHLHRRRPHLHHFQTSPPQNVSLPSSSSSVCGLIMTAFSTLRYIDRRPPNPFLGTTSSNRESHGGQLGHLLSLILIHDASLFNGMDGCYHFLELGCNDGTFTILCHGSVAYSSLNPFHSYMIELDPERYQLSLNFLDLCQRDLPMNISSHPGSYADEWFFLPKPEIINLYLNNFALSVHGDIAGKLRNRMEYHCLPGSILICFDTFFPNHSHWREERFIITEIPRHQISWFHLPKPSINSNPCQLTELPIFKYTKMPHPHIHPKSHRNSKPSIISFQHFWSINNVVR